MRYVRRNGVNKSDKALKLAKKLAVPATAASLLLARGVEDEITAAEFFSPSRKQMLDPFLFNAMSDTVELISEMIEAGIPIAVYSDYDCDGVCGAAIMKKTLEKLGAEVRVYIPDRFTEGYGTNARAMEMLADEAGLIITVDCGINSVDDVALVRDIGAEVVILDHHECSELPDTPYILNPKRAGERYPNKNLCGAGVAFKVAEALLGEDAYEYIDIAGTATIGDIVSLTGENRAIAALGIEKLKTDPCMGLKMLAEAAGMDHRRIDSYAVGFRISPRINVAGRLEHAYKALDLLLEESHDAARMMATYLNDLNDRRRAIQHNITVLAAEQVEKETANDRVILVRGEDFHRGVVGLAASSIAEKYGRPAIVLAEEDGMLTGSARSVEGVNIYEIMRSASDKYTKFGGHSQAAGVSFPSEAFADVSRTLNEYARKHYDDELFSPCVVYDDEISPEECTIELADAIGRMEPFGQDNPQPVFLMRGRRFEESVKMGRNLEHTRAKADGLTVIMFNGELNTEDVYDVSGTLRVNEYGGSRRAQYIINSCEIGNNRELAYIRAFLREASALEGGIEHACNDRDSFFRDFINDDKLSVMVVSTEEGERLVKDHLKGIPEYDVNVTGSPRKCILYCPSEVPAWCESIYLSASPYMLKKHPEAKLLLDDAAKNALLKNAADYFVPKDELSVFYSAYRSADNEYASISALMRRASEYSGGADIKKMWFALNVFFEEKLIAFAKSDKISLIYKKQSYDGGSCSIYECFERIVKGGRNC